MPATFAKYFLSLLVVAVVLAGSAFLENAKIDVTPTKTEAPIITPAPTETPPPTTTAAPETTAPPTTEAAEVTEPATTEADATIVPYNFDEPVPLTYAVEDDYFSSAAFIGDSRTDGFILFSGIRGADCYYGNGLTIFGLNDVACIRRGDSLMTIFDALAQKQYEKVYLSLGVNELGYYNDEGYYKAYLNAVDEIRRIQPNAVLYLQGLMPLNEKKVHDKGGPSYLTNEHLLIYNDIIRQVAEEKNVPFLDLNTQFSDENGELPYDASGDGVHPVRAYYEKWYEYLKTHTVTQASLDAALETEEPT